MSELTIKNLFDFTVSHIVAGLEDDQEFKPLLILAQGEAYSQHVLARDMDEALSLASTILEALDNKPEFYALAWLAQIGQGTEASPAIMMEIGSNKIQEADIVAQRYTHSESVELLGEFIPVNKVLNRIFATTKVANFYAPQWYAMIEFPLAAFFLLANSLQGASEQDQESLKAFLAENLLAADEQTMNGNVKALWTTVHHNFAPIAQNLAQPQVDLSAVFSRGEAVLNQELAGTVHGDACLEAMRSFMAYIITSDQFSFNTTEQNEESEALRAKLSSL